MRKLVKLDLQSKNKTPTPADTPQPPYEGEKTTCSPVVPSIDETPADSPQPSHEGEKAICSPVVPLIDETPADTPQPPYGGQTTNALCIRYPHFSVARFRATTSETLHDSMQPSSMLHDSVQPSSMLHDSVQQPLQHSPLLHDSVQQPLQHSSLLHDSVQRDVDAQKKDDLNTVNPMQSSTGLHDSVQVEGLLQGQIGLDKFVGCAAQNLCSIKCVVRAKHLRIPSLVRQYMKKGESANYTFLGRRLCFVADQVDCQPEAEIDTDIVTYEVCIRPPNTKVLVVKSLYDGKVVNIRVRDNTLYRIGDIIETKDNSHTDQEWLRYI